MLEISTAAKAAARWCLRHPKLSLAAVAALLVLAAEWRAWRRQEPAPLPPPRVVAESPATAELPRVLEEIELDLPDVPPDGAEEIGGRFDRPDVAAAARQAAAGAVGAAATTEPRPKASRPGSGQRGAQRAAFGGFVEGSVAAAGPRVAGVWTFAPPGGDCELEVLATLEPPTERGRGARLALTERWTKVPSAHRDRPAFAAAPLRLRAYLEAAKELWGSGGTLVDDELPVEVALVGLQLDAAALGRWEAAPYLSAGRIFGRDTVLAGGRLYFGDRR